MTLIEAHDAAGFEAYLKTHKNTICGRHPIAVLLHVSMQYPLARVPLPSVLSLSLLYLLSIHFSC